MKGYLVHIEDFVAQIEGLYFCSFVHEIPQNEEICVQVDKIFIHRELRLPQVEEYLVHVEQFVVRIKGLYFLNIRSLKMREFLCQILSFALI